MATTDVDLTRYDLSKFDTPGRGRGMFDAFNRHFLLRLLVRKGTATRYRNSVLGWGWSYVKPAMQLVVFWFVMGRILGADNYIEKYGVYVFAGIILVNLFTEGFGNATRSILENGALVQKIYLPRELFPLSAIIVGLVHFLPQVAILLVVCLVSGWHFSLAAVGYFAVAVVLTVSFALGLGMMFGAVNVRYRDSQNIVEIVSMFAVWSAPALYPWPQVATEMPSWLFHIYMCNPLAIATMLFHQAFWAPIVPAPPADRPGFVPEHFMNYGFIAVGITIICLILGQLAFRHFERTFAQDL